MVKSKARSLRDMKGINSMLLYALTIVGCSAQQVDPCSQAQHSQIATLEEILKEYIQAEQDYVESEGSKKARFNLIDKEEQCFTTGSCVQIATPDIALKAASINLFQANCTTLQCLTKGDLLTASLGTIYHELGHVYQDVIFTHFLPNWYTEETYDTNLLLSKSQRREYHADFLSGYMTFRVLWKKNLDDIFKKCGNSDQRFSTRLLLKILEVDNPIMRAMGLSPASDLELNQVITCIDQNYMQPYRNAAIASKYAFCFSHGLPEERKKAFDAGIAIAMVDAIVGENFDDPIAKQLYLASCHTRGMDDFKVCLQKDREKFLQRVKEILFTKKGLEFPPAENQRYGLTEAFAFGIKFVEKLQTSKCD